MADENDTESVARHSTVDVNVPRDAAGHPPHRIFTEPPVYFYATPFALATFPAWYDPGYWWEGRKPRFSLRLQLSAVGRAVVAYCHMMSTEQQWAAGWLVMATFSGDWRRIYQRILSLWFVWLGAIVALGLYTLVLAEPRYVGVWITILWLVLFVAVPWPRMNDARNLGVAVALAIAATSGIALAKGGLENFANVLHRPTHTQWRVAQSLEQMGLRPGTQVTFLGHTTVADYWAHLLRVRVPAVIHLEAMEAYWSAKPEVRAAIDSRLRAEGIRALIVATAPPHGSESRWQDVAGTGYYVKFL